MKTATIEDKIKFVHTAIFFVTNIHRANTSI